MGRHRVGLTTTIVVERSVMSYNGDNGFKGIGVAGSEVATLNGNVANDNGGNGIWSSGGLNNAVWSRNVVNRNSGAGLLVDGGTIVTASGNAGMAGSSSPAMECFGGSVLRSLQDNAVYNLISGGSGCYVPVSGF
jgi:hypothetical protein